MVSRQPEFQVHQVVGKPPALKVENGLTEVAIIHELIRILDGIRFRRTAAFAAYREDIPRIVDSILLGEDLYYSSEDIYGFDPKLFLPESSRKDVPQDREWIYREVCRSIYEALFSKGIHYSGQQLGLDYIPQVGSGSNGQLQIREERNGITVLHPIHFQSHVASEPTTQSKEPWEENFSHSRPTVQDLDSLSFLGARTFAGDRELTDPKRPFEISHEILVQLLLELREADPFLCTDEEGSYLTEDYRSIARKQIERLLDEGLGHAPHDVLKQRLVKTEVELKNTTRALMDLRQDREEARYSKISVSKDAPVWTIYATGIVTGVAGMMSLWMMAANKHSLPSNEVIVAAQTASESANRNLDTMILPTDLTDTGLLFYVAAPVDSPFATDTLLSNRDLARFFLNGEFLVKDVIEGQTYFGSTGTRMFDFAIPSQDNGELLAQDNQVDKMLTVTWASTLNQLFDTSKEREGDLKKYISWWYERTFQYTNRVAVKLNPDDIQFSRDESGQILDVFYNGELDRNYLIFNELEPVESIPSTSNESYRAKKAVSRPIVSTKKKLLLWTGLDQDLRVPEHLLKPAEELKGQLTLKFPDGLKDLNVTAAQLAYSIRFYFENKGKGELIAYREHDSQEKVYRGTAQLLNPKDPFAIGIVTALNEGVSSPGEQAERILEFWAENTEYITEREVNARRPMILTLIKGGGDCDNLALGRATLDLAQGLDAALIYTDTQPEKAPEDTIFSKHLLNGLRAKDLDGYYDPATASTVTDANGVVWVLTEPDNHPFGVFTVGETHDIRYVQAYDPVTRNLGTE